ncbi:MAG: DUF2800 domain-containing protein [Cupriavidus sp.]|nr:DUF2800 domain-containing protein [Cupriavidus sp.]
MSEATRAHSKYGGSTASRWMNCPGSVALCETIPPLPSSAYAQEGTKAHALAEAALLAGERDAMAFKGLSPARRHPDGPFSEDMCKHVQVYLDAVYAELDASPDAVLHVEQRFTLDVKATAPGTVFGTNDALVYSPSRGRLAVFDLKYGAGIAVKAEDNPQLLFYAAGAALSRPDWPVAEVEVNIVQPRAPDAAENGAIRTATVDPIELLDFVGDVEASITVAEQPGAEIKSGSWCRWCNAASICPVREKQALEQAGLAFGSVADISSARDLPTTREVGLDLDRLGRLLRALDLIDDWGKQVRDMAFQLATAGHAIPGHKLVEKMARRKWVSDEESIAAYLATMYGLDRADVLPPKLAGITEVERLLAARIKDKAALRGAKEDISVKFTLKESSGLTLVPAADKREPVSQSAAKAFLGVAAE